MVEAAYHRAGTEEQGAASGDRLLRRGPRMAAASRAIQVAERLKRSGCAGGRLSTTALNERIRIADLSDWFHREAIAAVNRGGRFRPGFEVVRRAVLKCVPGADRMWFDGERSEIVLSIDGRAQPFNNLSAGQRMMLAMVADIAIKAVTQNNYLVPEEAPARRTGGLPDVLAQTPGVVLIDELDVHLHPRVAASGRQRSQIDVSENPVRVYVRTRPR